MEIIIFKKNNYNSNYLEKIKKIEKMLKNKKINFFNNEIIDENSNLFVDKPTDYKPDIELQKWLKKKRREEEIKENKKLSFLNPINLKPDVFKIIGINVRKILKYKIKSESEEEVKTNIKNDNYYIFNNLEKTKNQLINYYYNLNLRRYLKFINNKNSNKDYFKFNNYIIIIVDIRKQKPIITVIINNKTFLCLTAGIVFKKMKMKEKKNKKSDKMISTMLKLTFEEISNKVKNNNILLNIKGLSYNLDVLYSSINYYAKNFNFLFLNSFHKRRNKLKFKKLKSIKRRLKKRFLYELNHDK